MTGVDIAVLTILYFQFSILCFCIGDVLTKENWVQTIKEGIEFEEAYISNIFIAVIITLLFGPLYLISSVFFTE